MKQFDFTKNGGFPLEQDQLHYMQTSYTELAKALATIGLDPNAGANTAVKLMGMQEDGAGNISN